VREASQGLEGIRQLRQLPRDLVITDIYMPDCDGLEVILTLRREFPKVKILANSGRGGPQDMLGVSELLGANAIVHKPLERQALLRVVEKLLDNR
jgi:CheY-like chemotaxis protein